MVGLGGTPCVIDPGQIGCPGVEVFNVDEGSFAELPGNEALGPDFFAQLGKADAGCLRCFMHAKAFCRFCRIRRFRRLTAFFLVRGRAGYCLRRPTLISHLFHDWVDPILNLRDGQQLGYAPIFPDFFENIRRH